MTETCSAYHRHHWAGSGADYLDFSHHAALAGQPIGRCLPGPRDSFGFSRCPTPHISPRVLRANRTFVHLQWMPTLFYVVSVLYLVTNQADSTALGLAWVYVVLRVAHTMECVAASPCCVRVKGLFCLHHSQCLGGHAMWLLRVSDSEQLTIYAWAQAVHGAFFRAV